MNVKNVSLPVHLLFREWVGWHPKLIDLFMMFMEIFPEETLTITSLFRHGDPGVHGTEPLRGVDVSRGSLEDWQGQTVAEEINKLWTYDPDRPEFECVKFHDAGSGMHFHLQVHDKTIYKAPPEDT